MNIPIKQYWILLRQYLVAQKMRTGWMAILLLTGIGLQLLNPQIIRFFIDTALAGGPLNTLVQAALFFIVVAFAAQGVSVLTTYISEDVAWTATNALRFDLAEHCLRLDQSFHKNHTSGELIERIDGDINILSNFFSQMVIHILGNLLMLVGVLVLLFLEDWRIGVALLFFAIIALAILIRIRTIAIPHWAKVREMSATFFGFLGEALTATEDVRANGARPYVMQRFIEITRSWLPLEVKASVMGSMMYITSTAVFAIGTAIAFGVGGALWQSGAITIGTVYLIFHYTELLRHPIEQIRNQIEDLQRAEASLQRVNQLFAIQSKLPDGRDQARSANAHAITFDNVSFSYDEREVVLHDIAFQLEPGQTLGLLGRTGSGKTTLARLALRLYDPTHGEIRLDDKSLSSLQLDTVRQQIGMVTQDVQLFQASVRENLTFFDPAISDERLEAVLNDLGLSGWLDGLSEGLDTPIQAGGRNLSAGQAQLLAFARVFLSDPGLVILDEASSRLDPATEQLIERAIDKLLAERTAIIIAHRLATIQRVDRVMILKDGRILEHGARQTLAEQPDSHFAQLLQTSQGLSEALEVVVS
ncbi:ABC transporter ATP-binding protein/permease [Chloroflexi bacterium TSY]|nr:ABC transporter ATP-binding protein/permease [Chloroflexi bacterium TSY]